MSTLDYHPLYLKGIEQFNRREFFQSHETWEELWLQVEGKERLFFKGLIQAAVALLHLHRGNIHGARKLLAGAGRYLEPFRVKHLGLNLNVFLTELDRCVDDATAHRTESGMPVVNPALIPEIRLQPASHPRPD
ncbi:MAG: DUF309 domain-containing protein [Rhodopirellula sp.]|nr:DUF309 domain-containing protein [Rhodopirellula sp.]